MRCMGVKNACIKLDGGERKQIHTVSMIGR